MMRGLDLIGCLVVLAGLGIAESPPETIGWHKAAYDANGKLKSWTSWDDAIGREIQWYLDSPIGPDKYPVCVSTSFMDDRYQATKPEVLPCTQHALGILSYLKYYEYLGKSNPKLVERAVQMGDYLLDQAVTPDEGPWPRFTRSTGVRTESPLRRSALGDAKYGANVIEPDKGGLAGYALAKLYLAPAGNRYMVQAMQNADILVRNMREGDGQHSPWPVRVDSVTGQSWGECNGNMVPVLRLFDVLLSTGLVQYQEPRDRLWNWIRTYQLDALEDRPAGLWAHYFEDAPEAESRSPQAALELARYLMEKRELLDPNWKAHTERLIGLSMEEFGSARPGGVVVMREAAGDDTVLGGSCSQLGAIAAMFHALGGGEKYKEVAYRNLNWMTYYIREDGVPSEVVGDADVAQAGGRQDACHTDVIHNFVDAMLAVPEWSDGPRGIHARPDKIGFHKAIYDENGKLVPWTTWNDAIDREFAWYFKCPVNERGYPTFVYTTFMNDKYEPYKTDIIPCTQDGMGILSYLKYWEYRGKSNPKVLEWARVMGDYLVKESLTPDEGAYPRFTRSTGNHKEFPIKVSSQGDAKYGVNVIEPDKGGLAGYALLKLHEATGETSYFEQAVHNTDVLVRNMRPGDATRSPWPFRVDSVTGKYWGERNGNMVFTLRLFDELIARGRTEYQKPRDDLWSWIKNCQIPAPETRAASLWIDFFEDQTGPDNRTSWAPLETARYLIEKKEALDPDWKQDAEKLFDFSLKYFSTWQPGGVVTMAEQDVDMRAWGGACSKLGGVAAMFYAAGGGEKYKELAYRNLTWMMYHIDEDGCPAELTGFYKWLDRGGWQEDCHTDVIHNFVDAINAVPEWGK